MVAADGERPNPVAPSDEVGGGRRLEHEGGAADRFEGKQEQVIHWRGVGTGNDDDDAWKVPRWPTQSRGAGRNERHRGAE
jgi:hypothetical protein